MWFLGVYFWLAQLGWIVSRLAALAACQHKPADLVQNLIISLLFSTQLNSTTFQVCQKGSSASTEQYSFPPAKRPSPLFAPFGACVCTSKGGVGGRSSSPTRQTSISLPKLESYLNQLAGNQPCSCFPRQVQGRVSSSWGFRGPGSSFHGTATPIWASTLMVCIVRGVLLCGKYQPKRFGSSEVKYRKSTLFFSRKI